jgi:hypothetical protein
MQVSGRREEITRESSWSPLSRGREINNGVKTYLRLAWYLRHVSDGSDMSDDLRFNNLSKK